MTPSLLHGAHVVIVVVGVPRAWWNVTDTWPNAFGVTAHTHVRAAVTLLPAVYLRVTLLVM